MIHPVVFQETMNGYTNRFEANGVWELIDLLKAHAEYVKNTNAARAAAREAERQAGKTVSRENTRATSEVMNEVMGKNAPDAD